MIDYDEVTETLQSDEGCRLKAYQDRGGVWTIGYGRNLQVLEITQRQAESWLYDDLESAVDLAEDFDEFNGLSHIRQGVIVSMVFQMGSNGVKNFSNMWTANPVRGLATCS